MNRVHTHAMRRVAKCMSDAGNLFANTRALEIYEDSLEVSIRCHELVYRRHGVM
jgi:hypothetical protein